MTQLEQYGYMVGYLQKNAGWFDSIKEGMGFGSTPKPEPVYPTVSPEQLALIGKEFGVPASRIKVQGETIVIATPEFPTLMIPADDDPVKYAKLYRILRGRAKTMIGDVVGRDIANPKSWGTQVMGQKVWGSEKPYTAEKYTRDLSKAFRKPSLQLLRDGTGIVGGSMVEAMDHEPEFELDRKMQPKLRGGTLGWNG